MAGLSNLVANSATQSTSLPSWMDTAQQSVVNQATTGAGQIQPLQNTVAGQAINTLQGPNNPFTQAQGTLQQISSGAANPWITDASGQVSPNTGTAMGGLFQAQNQQLQQLMPNVTAPVDAASIGSGNFGSLRGDTAYNKSIADAMATMNAAQYQAALQNQQTGVSGATGLGNVGAQGIKSETELGQLQQVDPVLAASTLGKIIGGVAAPQTVSNVTQVSPLNQIGSLASTLGAGVGGTNALLASLFPGSGTAGTSSYVAPGNIVDALKSGWSWMTGGGDGSSGVLPSTDEEGNTLPQ